MYQPDERYDIVEEALQDTKRGPIRPSRSLLAIVVLAGLWVTLNVLFLGYIFTAGLTLDTLKVLMLVTFSSPAFGVFCFLFGYSRRYRFILGKTVERMGLAILIVSIANMIACLVLKGVA